MLLSGEAEVIGFEDGDGAPYLVRDPRSQLVAMVGRPAPEAIAEAVYRNQGGGVMLVQTPDADYAAAALPDWTPGPAIIHVLGREPRLPAVPEGTVRPVGREEIAGHPELPPGLRSELLAASGWSVVAGTIVDGKAVAFCYAASDTETLWDISIDTLETYRRRGYASLAVAYMVEHMAAQGLRPVWGAGESNEASLALARKLGFEPVDHLVVFEPRAALSS